MTVKLERRKGWVRVFLLLLILAVVPLGERVGADSLGEKQEQLEDVNKQIDSTRKKIAQTRQQEKKILAELEQIEKDLDRTQSELARIEKELAQAAQKEKRLEKELQAAEQELARANAQLNQHLERFNRRLRAIYMYGEFSALEFLFSAEDFADLIVRAELMERLLKADVELYQGVKQEKAEVEATRQKVLAKKQEVEAQRRKMLALRAQVAEKARRIQAQAKERERVLAQIQARRESYEQALDELEATSRQLQAWIQEQQAKAQRSGDATAFKGTFLWPVQGRITSSFGWRVHPIFKTRRFHEGIDISVPMGTPVKSAAGGKVILAGWAGGYGKTVIIDHGGGISTLYGHNSTLEVAVGQVVYPGQVIAHAGSTGFSTGPHVHFEVRQNGAPVDPLPWLRKK